MRGVSAWVCLAGLATVSASLPRDARAANKNDKIVDATPRMVEAEHVKVIVGLIGALDEAVRMADTVAKQMPKDQSGAHQHGRHEAREITLPGAEIASMCADLSGHASVRREGGTNMDFVFIRKILSEVSVSGPHGARTTFKVPKGASHGKPEGSLSGGFYTREIHQKMHARGGLPGEFGGRSSFSLGEGVLVEGRHGNAETGGPAHLRRTIPEEVWKRSMRIKSESLRTFVGAARTQVSKATRTGGETQSRQGNGG